MTDESSTGFDAFDLSDEAHQALDALGYVEPTPVQTDTLTLLLEGKDVAAEAPTGTGKTAAFALAIVERTPPDEAYTALVLVPTRELASQVANEISALGRFKGCRAFAVTGGVREGLQLDRMTGANCIVATPGRLLDLLRRDELTLHGVQVAVIDEADRMFDEGFDPEVREVLALAPGRRQTLLFSATLSQEVMDLARDVLHEPEVVRAGGILGNVEHLRLNVRKGEKTDALEAVLKTERYDRALVFLRTKANVDATTRELRARGLVVDLLHGDRGAFERRHVMDLFRKGASRIVLATDVAARGLDVPEIDLVVNFDVPPNSDTYLHRGGRTGRMGRSGKVITFVEPDQKPERLAIERGTRIDLVPYRIEFDAKPPQAKRPPKPPRHRKKAAAEESPKKPQPPRPSRESAKRRAARLGHSEDEESSRRRRGDRDPRR